MQRERQLVEAFVQVADSLVDDFDVVDLLQNLVDHCVSLLAADAAAIMLADQRGGLMVAASSSESSRLLELFQLQKDEGPCLECYRTRRPVLVADMDTEPRWAEFGAVLREHGFRSVHALPLRLRAATIGTINFFHTRPGLLSEEDLRAGQALADVATISILQQRAIDRTETVSEQLQSALNSRVIIEQAKGVLAEGAGLDMDSAFACLRSYARRHSQLLTAVARSVVEGAITPRHVIEGSAGTRHTSV